MFGKFIFGAAVSLTALTALPASAEAQYYRDGYGRYYDGRSYNGYNRYRRGDYYRGQRYGNYYGRGYGYGNRHYRGRNCGSGTTGAFIGGAAGALLGREITRSNGRYRHRGNSGTTGAIIGGAVGALIGREVGRSC
jgi:Glycine zipper 2TM domain